jgi:hypothetical protein
VVSTGSYILSVVALAALALSLGFAAFRLRRRLMPSWQGAPARLVESILAIALLIWLSELLGTLQVLYAWTLVASSLLAAALVALTTRSTSPSAAAVEEISPAGGIGGGVPRTPSPTAPPSPDDRTRGPELLMWLAMVGVIAVVFAHWGLTTKDALDRGIFNFDSLWYHMPFAAGIAQSHSVTGLHYTETVFTNWFYPQNSELLHAVGILLTHRDTLTLFVNFAWLAIAFLAAWCVGRPYGRGHLSVVAAAIVLECHTLVVREPGAGKNDLMAAALLLAAIAILVNAWSAGSRSGGRSPLPVGWPLAAAGLAAGLAAGTKSTALPMAAVLTLSVVAMAPAGRRLAATGWWSLAALAGGGFWYLRNLIAVGNPLPQVEHLGPIALPHPPRLQSGRPDFSIAHYATDTGVWTDYFGPGLHQAFGALWPLVTAAAVAGGLLALLWGPTRILRWMGGAALLGLLAYAFTPLSAAGAEGAPVGFGINIRYAIPALLAGMVLLPLPLTAAGAKTGPDRGRSASRRQLALLGALLAVLVITDRSDAVLRDPDRLFGMLVALLVVIAPAGLLLLRRRGAPSAAIVAVFLTLSLAIVAIANPIQRDYLRDRFRNGEPETSIPGMHLDSAYAWARGIGGARIGIVGTTAGFLQYGFYGTDLSNRVVYLGVRGPQGSFNAIPDCREFRAVVNAARLDYLVTAPFLNFIHPDQPVASPEATWLRGESSVAPLDRSGPVTVWRVRGRLDPGGCGSRNEPLRTVPQQPSA